MNDNNFKIGDIVTYIGVTTDSITNGHKYEIIADKNNPYTLKDIVPIRTQSPDKGFDFLLGHISNEENPKKFLPFASVSKTDLLHHKEV